MVLQKTLFGTFIKIK